jgi:hypothetical protein
MFKDLLYLCTTILIAVISFACGYGLSEHLNKKDNEQGLDE